MRRVQRTSWVDEGLGPTATSSRSPERQTVFRDPDRAQLAQALVHVLRDEAQRELAQRRQVGVLEEVSSAAAAARPSR